MQRSKSRLRNLTILVFSAGALVTSAKIQKDKSSSSSRLQELRSVLIQARDAVIEYANSDIDADYDPNPVTKKVSELREYLIFADDREDIEYLREHLKKKYADEIQDTVPLPASREDVSKLVQTIEADENPFQHDGNLSSVISQEVERGFLDDALAHSSLLRLSLTRSRTQGEVAIAAYEGGKAKLSQRALDSAILSALNEDSTGNPVFLSASRRLDDLASLLLEHDYKEGARRVLLRNQELLSSSPSPDGFEWRFLAEKAIELGDFGMARETLEKVSLDDGRADLEDDLKAARGRSMNPGPALKNAKTIVDATRRSRSLCEIAERQSSAGDERGAAATFQLALHAAEEINQFKVFAINDIAWAQIHSGDTRGAEKTIDWAMKENETPRLGSDQVDGWAVLADTLAYLGQFERARETVMKISDSFYRGRGLGFIVSRGVEANRLQETVEWASKLSNPEDRAEAFLRIAEALVEQLRDVAAK